MGNRRRAWLPLLPVLIGTVLLVYMIAVEGEPGGIPLVLIVGGLAWFFLARARERRLKRG